jgi:hypothetical protein
VSRGNGTGGTTPGFRGFNVSMFASPLWMLIAVGVRASTSEFRPPLQPNTRQNSRIFGSAWFTALMKRLILASSISGGLGGFCRDSPRRWWQDGVKNAEKLATGFRALLPQVTTIVT